MSKVNQKSEGAWNFEGWKTITEDEILELELELVETDFGDLTSTIKEFEDIWRSVYGTFGQPKTDMELLQEALFNRK